MNLLHIIPINEFSFGKSRAFMFVFEKNSVIHASLSAPHPSQKVHSAKGESRCS